jgi:uncharacterized membrane protein
MRYDEAISFDQFASQPLNFLIRDYSVPNNHIFHNILVHFTTRIFGGEPWAIRLPALIAGILLIPVTAWLFKYFFGTLSGLLAAALVAGSSILIEYSINARGYSILTLIFLLLIALTQYLRRRSNLAGWLAFVVLSAIGFYTIPTMLYPFGMLIGWLLLSAVLDHRKPESRKLIAYTFAAGAAVVALTFVFYSPVILYHGIKVLVGNQYVMPLTWSQFLIGWPGSLRKLWIQWNRGLPTLIGLLLSAGVGLFFILRRRIDRQGFSLLIATLVLCVLAVFMQRVIPFERVWIFLVPIYLALAAAGFVALTGANALNSTRWTVVAPPLLLLLCVSIFVINSRSVVKSGEAFPDIFQVTNYFDSNLQAGDRIAAACPNDGILLYYAHRDPKLNESLHDDGKHPNSRIFIVVRNSDQTPQGVLKENRVPTAAYETPRLLKDFSAAALYEARPRTDDARSDEAVLAK